MLATAANHLDIIKNLIEAYAEVNQTNEDGSPALMISRI